MLIELFFAIFFLCFLLTTGADSEGTAGCWVGKGTRGAEGVERVGNGGRGENGFSASQSQNACR